MSIPTAFLILLELAGRNDSIQIYVCTFLIYRITVDQEPFTRTNQKTCRREPHKPQFHIQILNILHSINFVKAKFHHRNMNFLRTERAEIKTVRYVKNENFRDSIPTSHYWGQRFKHLSITNGLD